MFHNTVSARVLCVTVAALRRPSLSSLHGIVGGGMCVCVCQQL